MSQECSNVKRFFRGVDIMNYILEEKNVTLADVSKEFKVSVTTVRRDIALVGSEAFYGNRENAEDLKKKYIKVKKIIESNTCVSKKNKTE